MSPEELLDQLQQRAMVDAKVLSKLRRQLDSSSKAVSAQRIVKLLVDRGHLTAHQAQSLLKAEGGAPATTGGASDQGRDRPRPPAGEEGNRSERENEEEELGIAPGFEDELGSTSRPTPPVPPASAPPPLFELDDQPESVDAAEGSAEDLVPVEDVGAGAGPVPAKPAGSPPERVAPVTDIADDAAGHDELLSGATRLAPPGRGKWWRTFTSRHRKTFRSKQWDSPLMLVGGGALALLLLTALFLFLYLMRGSGDELFQQAEEDYRRGAYNQSIFDYDKFLASYPRHPKASLARVRSGLARLREAVEVNQDWDRALALGQQVLPQIKDEPAFDEARPELSSLLPDIYAGFVQQAKASKSPEQARRFVQAARQARQLVDNAEYLPTSLREPQQARLDAIAADVQLIVRDISRSDQLQAAVKQIRAATDQGKVAKAYDIRQQLLERYPRLATDNLLQEAVRGITDKEKELVRDIPIDVSPLVTDHELPVPLRVVMADRKIEGRADGLGDQVLYLLLRGAVYGVQAATGEPLWRRFVGLQTAIPPVALETAKSGDAIVIDQRDNELVRLEAKAGKLVWRLPMGENFAAPLVLGDRLVVATETGKLLRIDSATGKPERAVQLPQSLDVAPGIDSRRGTLYQVGLHSTLFALSADKLQCTGVFYLGHLRDSVAVPPVVTMGHVLIAENRGVDYCLLHVLATGEDGISRSGPPIRLAGQVVTPLILSERRVLVATDRGEIRVYQVDPGSGKDSVREVARVEGTAKRPASRYLAADRDRVWAGDRRLVMYQLRVARGELSQKWVEDDGDTIVTPLVQRGNLLFHVRQPGDSEGVSVAATRIADAEGPRQDGPRIWETELAVPLAGPVIVDTASRRVVAVSSHGAVYDIDGSVLGRGLLDRPTQRIQTGGQTLCFGNACDLGNGRFAYASASDARRLLLYDPRGGVSRLQLVDVSIPESDQSQPPVVWSGALLFPTRAGPVYLVDVDDPNRQKTRIYPFQPRQVPGRQIDWRHPAAVEGPKRQFVIADSSGLVYRVGIGPEPKPHLMPLVERDLNAEVVSPLATIGPTGYAAVRQEGHERLVSFQLSDLTAGAQWPLDGHVAWGPRRVADVVLAATDAGQLTCVEAGAKRRWSAPFSSGPLAGRPLPSDGTLVLASVDGTLWRVATDSGKTIPWAPAGRDRSAKDRFEVGEPLGQGPVVFGRRLLLVGPDGTLYVTSLPEPARSEAKMEPAS